MKIKNKIKEGKKMKKLMLGVLIGLLVISLVSAAWYFIFSTGVSIRIDSLGSQKDVTLSIPSINLNTTENSAKGSGQTTFAFNKAGTFMVDIIQTFGDLSSGQCLNGTNDCILNYSFDDGTYVVRPIIDKQIINITANSNLKYIYANISCVAYSCPQTRDIIIKLNQLS
jgi:cytoskeletal protein RodZ